MRVVVVGGGVIGCAVARELAGRGAEVVVVERDRPGAHASWAAAGMIAPLTEADGPSAFLELLRSSRSLFPALAAELSEETRIDVGYLTDGTLLVATAAGEDTELEERFRWQSAAALPVERLTPGEALALEPALTPSLELALLFPEDHQVDSRELARALWISAAARGVEFRLDEPVVGLLRERDRVSGVGVAGGASVLGDAVVVAGGSWAAGIAGLPRELPIRPVHGQLLALEPGVPLLRHVIASHHGYLVPRSSGRIIAGTTVEETGFRRSNTPEGTLRILGGAVRVVPSLAAQPLGDLWSGLRPGTPDALPVLGADPEVGNLFYATGHYRNGVALAPITALETARRVLGESGEIDLSPFAIERFSR